MQLWFAMPDIYTPADIERLAKLSGKSIAQVCREAKIAQSTFTRWKAGATTPSIAVYQRISAAAETRSSAA